jgi:riboflavin kinase / FMN adenylyltransferase
MDVVHGVTGLTRAHGRLFVVVGVFDGLHRGHHYLLARLREAARAHDARPAVITFDAHPDEIVLGHAPPLLLDPEERLARLAAAGVEVTVVQHFDAALRMTEYDVFVGRIVGRVGLAGFLMTPDAAFGHDRRGTPTTLAELGTRTGFEVAVVPPFSLEGRPVRSRAIREAIAAGDLAEARHLLGRPMAVTGDLVQGTMGFPIPVALPPDGSYRVTVEPAWTAAGRGATPRRSAATVDANRVGLIGGAAGTDPRVRVAFGRRLPEEVNPAILRRSQKKTSK